MCFSLAFYKFILYNKRNLILTKVLLMSPESSNSTSYKSEYNVPHLDMATYYMVNPNVQDRIKDTCRRTFIECRYGIDEIYKTHHTSELPLSENQSNFARIRTGAGVGSRRVDLLTSSDLATKVIELNTLHDKYLENTKTYSPRKEKYVLTTMSISVVALLVLGIVLFAVGWYLPGGFLLLGGFTDLFLIRPLVAEYFVAQECKLIDVRHKMTPILDQLGYQHIVHAQHLLAKTLDLKKFEWSSAQKRYFVESLKLNYSTIGLTLEADLFMEKIIKKITFSSDEEAIKETEVAWKE